MLRLVQRFTDRLAPRVRPIGIDFGSTTLRLAQVAADQVPPRVVAAAHFEVPGGVHRATFFAECVREALTHGDFKGREVTLALPAAQTHLCHLRLPKGDAEMIREMLPAETAGKLPIEPLGAMLRHTVAGDVYAGGEAKQEVICVAAERRVVGELLAASNKAKLDVVGMNTEAAALADCFGHVWQRGADAAQSLMMIDLGSAATRCYVHRGGRLLFARSIAVPLPGITCATGEADLGPASLDPQVMAAAEKLVPEIKLCQRYHDATFPNDPVSRLVFVGGRAADKALCQHLAAGVGVAAQVGDPVARMATDGAPTIDRRLPQPGWSAALGLSFGPVAADKPQLNDVKEVA